MQHGASPLMKCAVPLDRLDRYYMDRLDPQEAAEVRSHLDMCVRCSEYLCEIDVMTRALRLAVTDGI